MEPVKRSQGQNREGRTRFKGCSQNFSSMLVYRLVEFEVMKKAISNVFVSHQPTRLQGFPGGSAVKNLPAMQKMQVCYLDWEDPLEKEMTTHSSVLAWKIPWTKEPGALQSMGSQELDMT